jgi:hypothetical protein
MSRFICVLLLFAAGSFAGAQNTPVTPPNIPYNPSPSPPANPQNIPYNPNPPADQQVIPYTPPAGGQPQSWTYEGGFSAGFSEVEFPNANGGVKYSRGGPYIDGNVNFHIPGFSVPQVGFGITASGYFDNYSGGGYYYSEFSNVNLIEFEARASFPITFGDDKNNGLFVLPRIGMGLLAENSAAQFSYYSNYSSGLGFEVRPCVQLGYRIQQFSFGAEASYMWTWGGFQNLGSTAQEGRIGAFLAYRF